MGVVYLVMGLFQGWWINNIVKVLCTYKYYINLSKVGYSIKRLQNLKL